MHKILTTNRRSFIGGAAVMAFGGLPLFTTNHNWASTNKNQDDSTIHPLFPTTNPEDARAIVGASHTQFERVKELVSERPELAKANYDWGFGDWESALGAASHMGRKDIAELLIEYGARPNIFTLAMLGKVNSVKAMIDEMPGIEKIHGPHGFTLMHHANMRLRRKNVEGDEKVKQEELVDYLKTIEGSDIKAISLDISEEEQKVYFGTYKFGTGEQDFFKVDLNSRGQLFFSRGEYSGRALLRRDEHTFAPGGAPTVRIHFKVVNGMSESLVIHDPSPIIMATKA